MRSTAQQRIPQPHGGVLTPWPKGVSGYPRGRPSAGASFRDWLNQMRDWPEADLRDVADDPEEGAMKRAAARSLLRAILEGHFNATPLAANDLDRICDQTEGKPIQRVQIARFDPSPQELAAQMAELVRELAELLPHTPLPALRKLLEGTASGDSAPE